MFKQAVRDKRTGDLSVAKLNALYNSPDHDILILRASERRSNHADLLSIPVVREAVGKLQVGDYDEPRDFGGVGHAGVTYPGARKVMAVAREDMFGEPAGPLFCTLPVKPEPGTTFFWCYFANPRRLRRWSGQQTAASSPPPSLLVAENDGGLRLYESVAELREDGAKECLKALQDGFIVGTLPGKVVCCDQGTRESGPTALVNLGALAAAPESALARVPDVIIVTPHANGDGLYKTFHFPSDGSRLGSPKRLDYLPEEPAYRQLVDFSMGSASGVDPIGPVLALMQLPLGADEEAREALVLVARNIEYRNEWIRAEWSGLPARQPEPILPGIKSLVVATADGRLHKYVQGQANLAPALNTETWNQLRNGCVLGTVLRERVGGTLHVTPLHDSPDRVPLVNLSSLDPEDKASVPRNAALKGGRP